MPNVTKNMQVGDAVLFESPTNGICEVRAMMVSYVSIKLLISQVSPKQGILGGFVDDDPRNLEFTPDEQDHVSDSVAKAKIELSKNKEISQEQLALIERKLNEIQEASGRLGQKDWMNYVAGSLTSFCISASFSPGVTSAVFHAVNSSFSWLFESTLKLVM